MQVEKGTLLTFRELFLSIKAVPKKKSDAVFRVLPPQKPSLWVFCAPLPAAIFRDNEIHRSQKLPDWVTGMKSIYNLALLSAEMALLTI